MSFACAATDPRHATLGFTVAVVEKSDNPAFAVGDHVAGTTGWQDYAVCDGPNLRVIDPDAAPLAANLGVLGITGLTAWVGLTRILDPKPGGTLVVTAPAVAGRQPHYGTHAIEGLEAVPAAFPRMFTGRGQDDREDRLTASPARRGGRTG